MLQLLFSSLGFNASSALPLLPRVKRVVRTISLATHRNFPSNFKVSDTTYSLRIRALLNGKWNTRAIELLQRENYCEFK